MILDFNEEFHKKLNVVPEMEPTYNGECREMLDFSAGAMHYIYYTGLTVS